MQKRKIGSWELPYNTHIENDILDIEMALFIKALEVDIDDVTAVVKVTKMENYKVFTILE